MKKILLIIAFLISGVMLNAQEPQFVSKEPQNRNVLIEMFTARDEPVSYKAHIIANKLMKEFPDKVLSVNIHNTSIFSPTSYPNLNTDAGDDMFEGLKLNCWPSGPVNRSLSDMSYSNWENLSCEQMAQQAECNIGGKVTIDSISRIASITVETYYTANSNSDKNYLTIMMLQDSIMGSQIAGSQNPQQYVDGQYCHMHVLRDIITDTWGDEVAPTTAGTLITKTYQYNIPRHIGLTNGVDVDLNNIHFVAFITEQKQDEISYPILNVCELDKVFGEIQLYKIIVKPNIYDAVNIDETNFGVIGYCKGATVSLKAVPNEGYKFAYWTEDNMLLSKKNTYTFTAQSDRNIVANFVADYNHWSPNTTAYSHNMVVTADVQFDGVSQNNAAMELAAFCGEDVRGSATLQHFEGVDKFLYQFLVYGNPDDVITFKLYDHNRHKEADYMSFEEIIFSNNAVHGTLNEPKVINFVPKHKLDIQSNMNGGVIYGAGYYNHNDVVTISVEPNFGYAFVNWTSEGEVVSTDKSFTVTITDDISYTANFAEAHSTILKNGWNWYSSYVDINGADGLNFMKKELSGVANILKGKSNFSTYFYDDNLWLGDLVETSTEEMYMIHLEGYDYTLSVAGLPVNPEEYPIELNPNWNWMAYPVSSNMTVNEAFINFKPSHGDILKSQTKVCQYYEGVGWMGELEIMEPGKGYMYQSNAQESITFTYPNMGSTRGAGNERNAEKYWDVDETKYSTNMNVIAIVMQDGKEVSDCEIAAFYEDECRGSARPMYIEQLDRYLTFLTIHGEGGETLKFKYYDIHTGEVSDLLNEMTYEVDGINGDVANPYIFGNNISDINAIGEVMANGVDFYPNPVNDKLYIETEVEIEEVSIFDIYGRIQNLSNSATQQLNNSIDVSGLTSGVYFVKVVTSEGEAMKRIVKK